MFGEILKKYRKERKLTQQDLADDFDVTASLISQWENNKCSPNPEKIELIAEYFCVSIDELFGFSAPKQLAQLNAFKYFPLKKYSMLSSEQQRIIGQHVESMIDIMLEKTKK